jgi:hypothetical protein
LLTLFSSEKRIQTTAISPSIILRDTAQSGYAARIIIRCTGNEARTQDFQSFPYSSVGAQYGYSMLWTMLFIYPFMAAIQEISARLGRITGRGIAGNLRRFYPRWALYSVVALLSLAYIINIGADIGAMGAAVNLLIGGPSLVYCVLFAVISVLLQVFIPYKTYSSVLKWLTLSLFDRWHAGKPNGCANGRALDASPK